MKLAELTLDDLRRKRDQAYEMAGLARQDNDTADSDRWTAVAKKYAQEIGERVRGTKA